MGDVAVILTHTSHQILGPEFQLTVHRVCFCTAMGTELCLTCKTVRIHLQAKKEEWLGLLEDDPYKIQKLINS